MRENFTESMFYQIRLTAKYLKLLGVQLFEGLGIEVPFDEFIALDVINTNQNLCQRDLAKLILKDRANTGRIVTSLEKKGFVTVTVDKKQNRLVKLLSLTKKGEKFVKSSMDRIKPYIDHVSKSFNNEYEDKIIEVMKDLRQKLSELVETQI